MAKKVRFDDFFKFANVVGLVTTEVVEGALEGFPPLEDDYNGFAKFSVKDLPKLQEFCHKNPEYHIATWLTGDDIDLNDDGEECVAHFENQIRVVNREGYFLATGDKDENIILLEYDYCPRDAEGSLIG